MHTEQESFGSREMVTRDPEIECRKEITLKPSGMAAIGTVTLDVGQVLEIAIRTHICFSAALNLDDLFMPTYITVFLQHLPGAFGSCSTPDGPAAGPRLARCGVVVYAVPLH